MARGNKKKDPFTSNRMMDVERIPRSSDQT